MKTINCPGRKRGDIIELFTMAMFPEQNYRLKKDPGAVAAALDLLPVQIASAWQQCGLFKLPAKYRRPRNILVCGMGASRLPADIIKSTCREEMTIPLQISSDYTLPRWVNRHTLILCFSYSGDTEEILTVAKAAQHRKLPVVAVAAGGQLITWARRTKAPYLIFEPRDNPSSQPRLGVAYEIIALLRILTQARVLKSGLPELVAMYSAARAAVRRFGRVSPARTNPAKQLATKLFRRIPLLIGAEWTTGNLRTWNNQIHENAKTFSTFDVLPDLHHHLLEGLRDRRVAKLMTGVVINDPDYYPRNQHRVWATTELLKRFGARPVTVKLKSPSRLGKMVELLAFGGYVSWYLSVLENIDPAPVPIVEEVKTWLAKR
jgi:glucose/mannose-6-phosphate isomerase